MIEFLSPRYSVFVEGVIEPIECLYLGETMNAARKMSSIFGSAYAEHDESNLDGKCSIVRFVDGIQVFPIFC